MRGRLALMPAGGAAKSGFKAPTKSWSHTHTRFTVRLKRMSCFAMAEARFGQNSSRSVVDVRKVSLHSYASDKVATMRPGESIVVQCKPNRVHQQGGPDYITVA